MVCLRNISVDALHKGDTEDDDDNNNNNNDNDDNNNNNNNGLGKPPQGCRTLKPFVIQDWLPFFLTESHLLDPCNEIKKYLQ
jgi:hypothetical protein